MTDADLRQQCREAMAQAQKALRDARRVLGLCIDCGKQAGRFARCLGCRERAKASTERLRNSA